MEDDMYETRLRSMSLEDKESKNVLETYVIYVK